MKNHGVKKSTSETSGPRLVCGKRRDRQDRSCPAHGFNSAGQLETTTIDGNPFGSAVAMRKRWPSGETFVDERIRLAIAFKRQHPEFDLIGMSSTLIHDASRRPVRRPVLIPLVTLRSKQQFFRFLTSGRLLVEAWRVLSARREGHTSTVR